MFSTWNYTKYMFYFVSCKLSIILNCSREGFYSMHRIAKSMDNVSHLYAKLLSWLISQALHSPYQWRWPLKILKPNEVIELAEPLTGERWIILEKLWKYLISTVFPRVNEKKINKNRSSNGCTFFALHFTFNSSWRYPFSGQSMVPLVRSNKLSCYWLIEQTVFRIPPALKSTNLKDLIAIFKQIMRYFHWPFAICLIEKSRKILIWAGWNTMFILYL